MPWNSPKRPQYWNSTSSFDFDHITAVDISFCTSLQNFIQIGPPSRHVDFQDGGSQQGAPFFCILATDIQTNKQMDSTDALSRSRCSEWQLNNRKFVFNVEKRSRGCPYFAITVFGFCFISVPVLFRITS